MIYISKITPFLWGERVITLDQLLIELEQIYDDYKCPIITTLFNGEGEKFKLTFNKKLKYKYEIEKIL